MSDVGLVGVEGLTKTWGVVFSVLIVAAGLQLVKRDTSARHWAVVFVIFVLAVGAGISLRRTTKETIS